MSITNYNTKRIDYLIKLVLDWTLDRETMSSTMSAPPSMMLQVPPQQHQATNQGTLPPTSLNPLRSQIEFYFSPENLAKDAFLQSQLKASDHIGAVPMHTICNFPKVRQINAFLNNFGHLPLHMLPMADPRLVRMALQGSSVVTVSQDGAWISPNQTISLKSVPVPPVSKNSSDEPRTVSSTPSSPSSQATASSSLGVPTHPLPPAATDLNSNRSERSIVILRDLPSTVSKQDVLQIFSSASVAPKAARPDLGDTWFVTFETEELAVKALASVRDKAIGNYPIRGCLKSEVKPGPPSDGTSSTSSAPLANSTSLPPMPMTYPVFPYVPMQQSHPAYGYVYSIPPPHGPIHVRAQPPHYYPYGYANQAFLRPMVSGYPTNPPPNFFQGRPTPQHPHATDKFNPNANNGKLNNRKWQNRKKQTGSSDQQNLPHPMKAETFEVEAAQKLHDKKSQKKKPQRQQGQQVKRKTQETNIDLGAEHFPALGGSTKPTTQTESKLGGYAQALLKKPEKPIEPLDKVLSTEMNKIAFSSDGTSASAHDDW